MDDILAARLLDLAQRCERDIPSASGFLNPAEQHEATLLLRREKILRPVEVLEDRRFELEKYGSGGYWFWGGYEGAERKRFFTFPAYLFYTAETVDGLLPDDAMTAVLIEGSGYASFTHRDYLGALMHLGIERDSIGDILPQSDCSAVLFALPPVAGLLMSSEGLTSVGRDRVKVAPFDVPDGFGRKEETKRIEGVVSSTRLDCAAAVLCCLSREKAKELIRSGLVQRNYEDEMSPDAPVEEGDVISVRGYGRYRIEEFGSRTRKDRLHIAAVRFL